MTAPAEQPVRKNFFRGIVKGAARAAGIETVPSVAAVDAAVQPQAGFAQPPIPSAVEDAFQNAPEGTLDPTIPTPASISEAAPSSSIAPAPTIVPAEPVTQVSVTETRMEPAVSVSSPLEESNPTASPVETTVPMVPEPSPQEPVVQAETVAPVESTAQEPAKPVEPAVLSMDFGKSEAVEEAVPEDPVATKIISQNPELFIKDGILDFEALKAAKEIKLIAENPKAQHLVDQLRQVGVVDKSLIVKLTQSILSETQKAA